MAENSKIEWTDHTFNPWWGCTRVSPGCVHCYAETFDKRVHGKEKAHWGVSAGRRFFGDKHWNEPLKWNAKAGAEGIRRRVFCASMADVFEDRPELVEPRARLFALIEATPGLDWLLLTKRPENMERLARDVWPDEWPPNVWAGCTVEDQQRADERILELVSVPAAIRFLSCEPLIGPVDLRRWLEIDRLIDSKEWERSGFRPEIDWVICGGESGHGARPMDPEWARSLRDQCQAAGVAFLFKQWGEHDGSLVRLGKHAAGRELDGRTWDQFPEGVHAS